jgi:malate permease and related proteins
MDVLFLIIVRIILPVFSLIGIGLVLHRKFKFDINTLSKLTTYFLMPAVSFLNVYESQLNGNLILIIIGFLLLQSLILMVISSGISRLFKFDKGVSAIFKNSVVLMNSGNFGLPVSQLVFQNNPLGASIQIIVMIFQNLLTFTYGLLNSVSVHHEKGSKIFLEFLKIPTLYAVLLGLLLQTFSVKLPLFLSNPIENAANAFLAIALVTLGAQSAYLKIYKISLVLSMSILGRLVLAPLLALLIITCLGIEGTAAQALFIASSFPTSRNSSLFALEYNNHPETAAQVVLVSTMLSSVTVTIVVYMSKILFT